MSNEDKLQPSFDYTTLEESKRIKLQIKTEAIRLRIKRTAEDIIAIGQDLIEIKQDLEHGQFQHWLKAEFDMSYDTAIHFMHVAKKFGGRDELKSGKFPFLSASILYELAGPRMPEAVVEAVLTGKVEPTHQAIKEAKEAQRKAEDELEREYKERSAVEKRIFTLNYEQQILLEDLRKIKQERDHLKKELDGGLQAYYDKNLQMKVENTFLGLLSHGMQRFAETQQFVDHITSTGMLSEVRRLGESHQERFLIFLAQLQFTYHALYEAEIKLTGPLTKDRTIIDEDQPHLK